jgi:hypothetical protein
MSEGCGEKGCVDCFRRWVNQTMDRLTGYTRSCDGYHWWKHAE